MVSPFAAMSAATNIHLIAEYVLRSSLFPSLRTPTLSDNHWFLHRAALALSACFASNKVPRGNTSPLGSICYGAGRSWNDMSNPQKSRIRPIEGLSSVNDCPATRLAVIAALFQSDPQ